MNTIQAFNVRARDTEVPPEVHNTREAQKLKESCQQFESILWAQIWKKAKTNSREFTGGEKGRTWKQMEDLAVEMASEEIAKGSVGGLWKVIYDQMIVNLAADMKSDSGEDAEDV
jgi:Rod binding domain-containing protein